jgi:very-short-patch-repair endonuclease
MRPRLGRRAPSDPKAGPPAKSLDASGGGVLPRKLTLRSIMTNERARALRKNMSEAERKLWRGLRHKRLDGARFRRQHPIGRFIVDFVCLERRLVVEVDGGQHTEDAQVVYDARRDRWLEAEGYRVMCVATAEVYVNVDGVLDTIWAALGEQMSARGRDTPT